MATQNNFVQNIENVLRLGLVDDTYPLGHASVQLPNGFFAISTVLNDLQAIFENYDFDETMMPSVSTSLAYQTIPPEFKGEIDQRVMKITHTGLTKLPEPMYMQGRADLQMVVLEKENARSYRDLPIKRIMRGFRYIYSNAQEDVPLLTDTEQSGLDAVGIYATEAEYRTELDQLISQVKKILVERLFLSTIDVRDGHSIIFYSILPNNQLLEVARFRLYDQALSNAIKFTVLGSDNKQNNPFIFAFQTSARLFVATLAAHSSDFVVLPSSLTRAHVIAFNNEKSILDIQDDNLRVEVVRFSCTPERLDRYLNQGHICCVEKTATGFKIYTKNGQKEVTDLKAEIVSIIAKRDADMADKERAVFQERKASAVHVVEPTASDKIGFPVDNEKPLETQQTVILGATTFIALA